MKEEIDKIETLLLMALDGAFEITETPLAVIKQKDGTVSGLSDQGLLLKTDDMTPKSMYTFDMCDNSRLFTSDPGLLIAHPSEILGDEAEMFFHTGDCYRWAGFRRVKKKPKGVAVMGKPDYFYEYHYRDIRENGSNLYNKRFIPIDKKGRPLIAKIQNQFICAPAVEGVYLCLACSMIEDAHRSNAMLASFEDGVKVYVPVPLDNYQEIFFDREAPLIRGKKKAIIHWVAKHIRKSKMGNWHTVKKHVRGVKDIVIDGMTVNISPNRYA